MQQRDQLGVMGHTGDGLNQTRAHLHLELNLMLSRQFESWHDSLFKTDPNRNGLYNGLNLIGIDIARLYLALRERPALTIPEFLSEEETLYRVLLPDSGHFDLPKFYPWMLAQKNAERPVSWEVSFNRAGVPLKIEPSGKQVGGPELSYLKPTGIDASSLTRGHIAGRGQGAHLTDKGKAVPAASDLSGLDLSEGRASARPIRQPARDLKFGTCGSTSLRGRAAAARMLYAS